MAVGGLHSNTTTNEILNTASRNPPTQECAHRIFDNRNITAQRTANGITGALGFGTVTHTEAESGCHTP